MAILNNSQGDSSAPVRATTLDKVLVVGMGKTGLSCVRFLLAQGCDVRICDSRATPPALVEIQQLLPAAAIQCGEFQRAWFESCRQLVVSPGVAIQHDLIQQAQARGVEVIGDIELFARHVEAPVVAITGSNGKSTVTALVAAMLEQAGATVQVGGNFGTPALALLTGDVPDVYVLELSSFQLETTSSLQAEASVVLNISPDHMDRYTDESAYLRAKQRVWRGQGIVIVNRDEPGSLAGQSVLVAGRRQIGFTLTSPLGEDYGLRNHDGQEWLVRGDEYLLSTARLRMVGRHNTANGLAALALIEALFASSGGFFDRPMRSVRPALLQALSCFRGLPHRMECLAEVAGVSWVNDSKGTNVGATLAALQGLPASVVLIAGGVGKGADFSPLAAALAAKGRAVILIGQDADQIEASLEGVVPCLHAADMGQAVSLAATQAQAGDVVLLSPACASFDMFDGYEQRGQVFAAAVEAQLS